MPADPSKTPAGFSFADLCRELGKSPVVIGQLQANLDLPRLDPPQRYSEGYAAFLQKCLALRTFGVAVGDIQDLLRKELKLLRMLNLDSQDTSSTWYLDQCRTTQKGPERLLLTGVDVGFSLEAPALQPSLDFGQREPELFESHQMGENPEQVLSLYRRQRDKIRRRVAEEREGLRRALTWANRVFQF